MKVSRIRDGQHQSGDDVTKRYISLLLHHARVGFPFQRCQLTFTFPLFQGRLAPHGRPLPPHPPTLPTSPIPRPTRPRGTPPLPTPRTTPPHWASFSRSRTAMRNRADSANPPCKIWEPGGRGGTTGGAPGEMCRWMRCSAQSAAR